MHRAKHLIAIVACVLGSAIGAQSPKATSLQDYEDSEGYAVLSVLLDHPHSYEINNILIISPVTSSGSMTDSFDSCGKIPDEFKLAAADFANRNKQRLRLQKKFKLTIKYDFTDSKKKGTPPTPAPGEQELPPSFYQNTLYEVSAVGFDASRTHAIAYLAAIGPLDSASAGYHLLVREKDAWKEVGHSPVCQWISFSFHNLIGRRPA
jgi:hypothetical protein